MKYRGIFEYEYPTEHKMPVSIDVHLHGDCVKGKIIEWEYRPLEQNSTTKNDLGVDCISREQAKTAIRDKFKDLPSRVEINTILNELPSVTPQEHRWIPMVRRKPTDEEKAEYLAQNGEELCYMLENEMPLNGQEVLVSIGEFVSEDIFDEDFYNFENNDIENVDAWMPSPEPYKSESEDKE